MDGAETISDERNRETEPEPERELWVLKQSTAFQPKLGDTFLGF